ncbi:hypothetical protein HDU86_007395 [Geranomyces michiganensis]|nr:hypothetical protein HDU86_007395 [Geranomyces michiganensis]
MGPAISKFAPPPPRRESSPKPISIDRNQNEEIEDSLETVESDAVHATNLSTAGSPHLLQDDPLVQTPGLEPGDPPSIPPLALRNLGVVAEATDKLHAFPADELYSTVLDGAKCASASAFQDSGQLDTEIAQSKPNCRSDLSSQSVHVSNGTAFQDSGRLEEEIARPKSNCRNDLTSQSAHVLDDSDPDDEPEELTTSGIQDSAIAQPYSPAARRDTREIMINSDPRTSQPRQSLEQLPRSLTRHDSTLSVLLGERSPRRDRALTSNSSPMKSQSNSLSFDFDKEIGEITHFLEDDVDLARPRSAGPLHAP